MPGHLKRKRPYGASEPAASATTTTAAPTPPAAPRRATRQSSIPPLPVPEDPEPRRRRRRADANTNGQPAEAPLPSRSPRGKENMPVHSELQHLRAPQLAKPTTRLTRHSAGQETPYMAAPRPSDTNIHRTKSAAIPAPIPTAPMPAFDTQRPTAPGPGRGGRTVAADPFIHHQQSVSLGRNKPIIMTTSVRSGQIPTSKPNGAPGAAPIGTDSTAQPDRNIDKVVLGDICFRAWYPSYYGKEVLGDISGSSTKGGKEAKSNGSLATSHHYHESKDDPNGAKTHGRRDRENHPPMLDRLYVCPCCFKYSKELVAWWEHVRWCERRGYLPGNKIYTHPKGKRTVLVPSGPAPKQGRGKRGSVGQRMVEEVVQDEGEWSIREVDGEEDVLFCQNLSLFAKLFLDNKSVFFDVTGFNYFLLVHTPPPPPQAPTPTPNYPTLTTTETTEITPPPRNSRSQIVGFFSKEKMSWDNNNLACILVFPPWQRKGLGALLMGISYAISRREGLLGGPEKPISDLGRRGYKRFWGGEVCRWLLGLSSTPVAAVTAGGGEGGEKEEIVVDVDACSQATWIAPEDCLLVLREMGLAEEAGTGPPSVSSRARVLPDQVVSSEEGGANIANANGTAGAMEAASAVAAAAVVTADQVAVRRVRISQAAVRAWVAANRISLERACDPDGFVEGYAMKGRAAASEEPV